MSGFESYISKCKMIEKEGGQHDKIFKTKFESLKVTDGENMKTGDTNRAGSRHAQQFLEYGLNETGEYYVLLNKRKLLENFRNEKRYHLTMMSNSTTNRIFHPTNIQATNSKTFHRRLTRASSDSLCLARHQTSARQNRQHKSRSFNNVEDFFEKGFYSLQKFGGSTQSIPKLLNEPDCQKSKSIRHNNSKSNFLMRERSHSAEENASKRFEDDLVESSCKTPFTNSLSLPGISVDKLTEQHIRKSSELGNLLDRTSRLDGDDELVRKPPNKLKNERKEDLCSSGKHTSSLTFHESDISKLNRTRSLPSKACLRDIKEVIECDEEKCLQK